MLKRFFVALIVGLLMMSSQIAAAEVDWNKAPLIGSKAELARYIENGRCAGQTAFYVILTYFNFSSDEENFNKERDKFSEEFSNGFEIAIRANVNGIPGTGRLIYTIKEEYPGTRVANAHLSGNTSNLNSEEQNLYDVAVGIVNEANKLSSEREKAKYIHDEICNRVEIYEEDKNTAIYALIYKKANCMGYADAFYMLGRMCGLNVGRIGGYLNNGTPHAWNTITFNDGKTYCVDVRLDDAYNSDYWFLATFERMNENHWCEWEIIPNLQRT